MPQLFKYKNKQRGFTLTEILIVVLIVSVLAAIAYPIYTKSATKSRAVEAINLLEMVRNKQLFKYAHDKTYYTDVTSLGQITSNKKQESVSEQELKIKDYTISLNAAKNCATAAYEKGTIKFSFSSGYENTGLGCTGDICTSFGNIIGGASDVCNCNGATPCGAGFVRNQNTCGCECNLCLINGTCVAPTQTQQTSRTCGNNGTQVRSCTSSCDGGSCGPWGACTGQTCPAASKPIASESCGNCGTHTRTVTCDGNSGTWTTTAWGSCGGEGTCTPNTTQSCGSGGTQTCTSSCQWSSTCVEPACPASCSDGYTRTSATTGNFAACCTCVSPKTTKIQSGGCDVNGNCQADKMICTCPNSNDYTKCTTTGGTWVDASCSCTCPTTGKNPFDSTTGCACPTNKAWLNWRYTSGPGAGPAAKQCICSNAIDYNASAGGACSNTSSGNDMEARCKGLFCQPTDCSPSSGCRFLTASEAVSYPQTKFDAERTTAGTWNATTCSCTCPAGGTLTSGRCYMCTSPLVWNGSSCACQLNCAMGYGTLDNYGYNTNAVRASTGCSCVCPTGQTWDYHGVTNLGQAVKTCGASCSGSSSQTCGKCGTQTRTCNTTTGQWGSWSTCSGETGTCTPGATQSCNGSGTKTCSTSCTWGQCSNYCDDSNVPARTQTCGTCGRQYRVVSCNTTTGQWTTSAWLECMECPTGYYAAVSGTVIACQQCTNAPANASYSGCSRESTCAWTCNSGYTQSGSTCVAVTCPAASKPATSQSCGNCNKGTQIRDVICDTTNGTWTTYDWEPCSGGGTCAPGDTQACGAHAQQTCTSSCTWGTCVGSCAQATKPAESQSCGNCNTGTQTRTVTCDTSTYTWTTTAWSSCLGGGACAAGATQSCGGGKGVSTCASSCSWGSCVCNSGYSWNGSTCVSSINISTTTVNILVTYSFSVVSVNYQACYAKDVTGKCSPADSKTYYQGGYLGYDNGSMNGPSMCQMGAEGTEGHSSGWVGGSVVSLSSCPSGTNQSICAANCTQSGCSYRCILSESYPSSSSPYTERRCAYPCEIDSDVGCNDESGTATVLLCSRS